MSWAKIVEKYFTKKEFSPASAERLWKQAEETEQMIRELVKINADTEIETYHEWLKNAPLDARAFARRHDELKNQLEEKARDAGYALGDWRESIANLEDGAVKLLLTDPPYGMSYQSGRNGDRHENIKNDTQDVAVGELWDCMKECFPKLQENAHVLCFCHWKTEYEMRQAIENSGFAVKGLLIWEKNEGGMGDLRGAFAPKYECIIHAVKGAPILYQRKADVFHAAKCDSKNHPTEKPVALLEELIRATTVEGDLVLDPFAGVASTLVAAKNLDRNYFGCEIEEKYYEIGRARLNE
jgi:site-specific DNA-methyltransferase (adenine-specific)